MSKKNQTAIERQTEALREVLEHQFEMTEQFKREGSHIVVPEHITLRDAGAALMNYAKEMEEDTKSTQTWTGMHPDEALVAFYQGVEDTLGRLVAHMSVEHSFFGSYKVPGGKKHTVTLDYGVTEQYPIDVVKIPGVPLGITISINHDIKKAIDGDQFALHVEFEYQRKYEKLVRSIITATDKRLKNASLFKGKAINSQWQFLDLSGFDISSVSYSHDERRLLGANLFTPIKQRDNARKMRIPLKRGILLHGPYGTGKSLTARVTAQLAVENGWTFIQVRDTDDVTHFIEQARRLQPAVVFFEDVDTVLGGERNAGLNSVLNAVDGILSKDAEVITVLTTNHIEQISRAMLRPGRLDAIVKLGGLDAERTVTMVRKAFERSQDDSVTLTDGEPDMDAITKASGDYPPAFVAEAITKSRLYGLESAEANGSDQVVIDWDDIVMALTELRGQYELMQSKQEIKDLTVDAATNRIVRSQLVDLLTPIYADMGLGEPVIE